MFSTNHFTHGVSQSIGETAVAATLTAARWGVLAWDWYYGAFFSPAAQRRYEEAGRYVWLVSAFTFGLGVLARRWVAGSEFQAWVDAQVAEALPQPPAPVDATPVQPSQPAAITAPAVRRYLKSYGVVTVLLPAPESPLTEMGIRQLKALASEAKVKGYGRMSKAQLIAALEGLRE